MEVGWGDTRGLRASLLPWPRAVLLLPQTPEACESFACLWDRTPVQSIPLDDAEIETWMDDDLLFETVFSKTTDVYSLSFLTLLFMVPMLVRPRRLNRRKNCGKTAYGPCVAFCGKIALTPEESALFSSWNEEEEKLKAHGDAVRAIETQLKSTESDEKPS